MRSLIIFQVLLYATEFLLDDDQTVIDERSGVSCRLVLVFHPLSIVDINESTENAFGTRREPVLERKHENGGFLAGQ